MTATTTPIDVRSFGPLDAPTVGLLTPADERAARADLLRQIARLEDRLSAAFVEHPAVVPPCTRRWGPRLLDVGALEQVRDELVDRLDAVRAEAIAAEAQHAEARALLEEMYADPRTHKWVRVSREQLGLKGCGHYHVRPKLGLIGLLRGWWVVKVSSGCPLAEPAARG